MTQLRLYKWFLLLHKFAFTACGFVYTTILIENFGFSNQKCMTLNFFYFASSLLLELPTGMITDKFGAKKSIVLGSFCWALGTFVYSVGQNYNVFILAELCSATGAAFLSGALDCWIGGHFETNECFADFRRNLNQQIRILSIVLTITMGFFADRFGMDVPYYVATGFFLMSSIVTLFFDEKAKNPQPIPPFKQSLQFYFGNPKLFGLGMLSMVNMLWLAPVFMLWGPVIKNDMGLSPSWIGIASSVLCVGMFCGGYVEHKIASKLKLNLYRSEIGLYVIKGLSIIALSLTIKVGIVTFLIAFFIFELLHEANMQFHIIHVTNYYKGRSDEATIASIHGLMGRVGGGLGNLCLGVFADYYGRQYSWIIAGVMMIASSVAIYYYVTKSE
ncbi:MAG: MFS transporter [Patescibacteria group bacterium]